MRYARRISMLEALPLWQTKESIRWGGIWDENGWEMDGLKMGFDDDISRKSGFHSF